MTATMTRPAAGRLAATLTTGSQALSASLMAMANRFGEQADAVELAALAARMQVARLEAAQAACREQLARHAEAVSQAQQMLEESVADAAADAADLAEVLAKDAAGEGDGPQNGKPAEVHPAATEAHAPPAEDDDEAGCGAAPAREWPEAPLDCPETPEETALLDQALANEHHDLAGVPDDDTADAAEMREVPPAGRPSLAASSERIEANGTAQAQEVTAQANAPLLGVPAVNAPPRKRAGRKPR